MLASGVDGCWTCVVIVWDGIWKDIVKLSHSEYAWVGTQLRRPGASRAVHPARDVSIPQ